MSASLPRRAPRWPGALAAVLVALALSAGPAGAQPAQPEHGGAAPAADHATSPADQAAGPGDHRAATDAAHAASGSGDHGAAAHGEEHGESIWGLLSRIANFLVLAGGLFYLLRSPLGNYLGARADQIRGDLLHAAHTRRTAEAELKDIEARLAALPGEIAALQARGKAEVEAEHERIRAAAAAERERLLGQARREIDQQLQAARRALRHEAADLAVSVARTRIAREITDTDRLRLVDRYVSQVKAAHD
jgi:ATP synthase F0 subunit b